MIFEDARGFAGVIQPGSRLMGLDVGTKTIGLAMSDVSHTIATPLKTIMRKTFKDDMLELKTILQQHEASALVMGYPINMNGTLGPRCQSIRQFARNVEGKLPIPILLWDERMSTMAVSRAMNEAALTRERKSEVVDKMAAAYILQGLLDFMKMN